MSQKDYILIYVFLQYFRVQIACFEKPIRVRFLNAIHYFARYL